ncbi:hypothetical protein [Vibrio gazogenes]|uniref:Uncharacterized protein n=1 Tax=Vibrio gazogenes DSM 21264 = NBRC 103151 TaxID=1123492 RepID=A0A1M4WD52_VIBGA|nr:hypothetical protein [Vibrio gazogenes]USP13234.1 hypothetical protein MKS89_12555 [Vibrio gazogenes]SHE79211.1 hypothetical protein SAMN02745781_00779 [Vibrio gazogenes DSM 21264] [Vibrio gazogenes DSM 21264 = NBRC 103151]SJN59149.1 hypothetical protein BQ6471_03338 [Vibrio gazogenes]
MSYRTIQVYNLMAYEFTQVEGDFMFLRESDVKSVIPFGISFPAFLEQLRIGHQVLLTDVPSVPLLIRDRDEWGNLYWRVNPVVESNLDSLAHKAYTERAGLVNHGVGSFYSGSVNALVYTEPYIEPEPVKLFLKERYEKQCQENHLNSEKTWAMLQERKAQEKAQEQQFSLGWMQVESTQSQQDLWTSLFTSDTATTQKQLVKKYNTHLNEPVCQGEIVILPTTEPTTDKEKQSLTELQEEAQAASTELAKLSDEEVATVYRHFELLDYYASNGLKYIRDNGLPSDQYAYASVGVSAVATGIESHLKHVGSIIQEINSLYVTQVAMASRTGGINYGSFVAERAALLNKLDQSFTRFSSRAINIPAFRQVKKSLRLSTKSVIHNADDIIKSGVVPNLGKRIANISVGVWGARGVGYLGLGLAAASGVNNIYDACSVDGRGECGKTTAREVVGFFSGWIAGVWGIHWRYIWIYGR